MYYTRYDKIVVALQLDHHLPGGGSALDGHDSVMRVLDFDNSQPSGVTTVVRQQHKWFGRAASLVMWDDPLTEADSMIYIGGCADHKSEQGGSTSNP